jgi:hypothetical protein
MAAFKETFIDKIIICMEIGPRSTVVSMNALIFSMAAKAQV